MKKILLLMCAIVISWGSYAQNVTVSGTVTSADDGSVLPGVNVLVKGTAIGTATDADGKYSLSVPSTGGVLVFSFIGLKSQEIEVGGRTTIDISLALDATELSEVVVTALGIEREKSSLGYATQQVSGDNIRVAREQNVNTALAGKIAGVQVISGSGAKFGAPAIRIRGIRGLSGNNPLYVLDGIVIDDPTSINMDNIDAINVLKGNAAALYGSRARDGVVVLTSKKGGNKGDAVTIDLNHTTTFENVYVLPEYQNQYGGGYDQSFSTFNYNPAIHDAALAGLDGANYPEFYADESWGPRMDGTQVAQWDSFTPGTANYGKTHAWSPQEDNVRNFFRTGVNNNTSITLGKSNEKYSLNATVSRSARTGVMENTNQDKFFMNIGLTANLTEKLSVQASANYSDQYTKGNLFEGYNSIASNFNQWFQRQLNMDDLRKYYKKPDGTYTSWNINSPEDLTPLYWDNPYTYVYGAYSERERDVLSAKFGVSYEIIPKLKASILGTRNLRNDVFSNYVDQTMLYSPSLFSISTDKRVEDNIQGMLSYDKRFGDFSVLANVGMNWRTNTRDYVEMSSSGGLNIRGLYTIRNSINAPVVNNSFAKSKVNSVFTQASVGWKDMVYLDLTYRDDYDSKLPNGKNKYSYYSASGSFVFTEAVELPWLSFGKFRASYATSGNELNVYQTAPTYALGVPYNGNPITAVPNNLIDPSIRAAVTSASEVGLELAFLDGRLTTEFSYYYQDNSEELLNISIAPASGGSGLTTNSIDSFTRGWELAIGGTPVKTSSGFTWNVNFNVAQTYVEVVDIGYGLTSFALANAFRGTGTSAPWGGGQALARKGEEWGVIVGRKFRRDAEGNLIVNAAGVPQFDANQDMGHILPDFTGGMFNRLTYKGFELAFTIDYQAGGAFHSVTKMFNAYSGLAAETAGNNELGNPKRDPVAEGGGLTWGGVFADGTPNTIRREADAYYKDTFGLQENWMYNASFIKMRELRLGYSLSSGLLDKIKFLKGASIAFVANNPWLIYSKVDGIDPSEIGGDTVEARNNGSWVESGNLPGTRTYGFDLRLKF